MAVWSGKNNSSTTSWTVDTNDNVVSAWDTREGYDAEGTQMGEILQEAGIQGTYTSPAQASAAYIGSKYKLADDRDMTFGHSNNIRIRYDTTNDGFLIHTGTVTSTSIALLTIRNNASDVFRVSADGSIKFKEVSSLPSSEEGSIVYYNNEFYLAK